MDTITKKITITFSNAFIKNNNFNMFQFFKSKEFRNQLITSILKENINYKSFEIIFLLYFEP